MKPDWCPQDVWAITGTEFDELYEQEDALEGGCEHGIRVSMAKLMMQARAQAFEDIASYVEGKDGKIPAAAVFAPLVSQNRMPDMSGDHRARLSPPRRREFDDATRALSQAIRQHSQKGRDNG